jgi:hypothetical protein
MRRTPIRDNTIWQTPADWYYLVTLVLITTLAWCIAYNRWSGASWKTPILYGGDALAIMANIKAQATGEFYPILTKNPISLGAPFRANWNDYPTEQEGVFTWSALLAKAFGLFAGSNLAVFSASLLAACSFYYTSRQLSSRPVFAAAGAILFSFSRYIMGRGLSHMGLSFYWHVPLALLVVWYCLQGPELTNDYKKRLFCFLVAVLVGIQNIYYTGIFLQFIAGTALYHLLRRGGWPRVRFPVVVIGFLLATCLLMNVDTLYYGLVHGRNPATVVRPYAGLELYALKPVELFLPFPHRLSTLRDWAFSRYFTQAYFLGETGSSYLGIIGITGLVLLGWRTVRSLIRDELSNVPRESWYVLWVILFSTVGGINGIIGVIGLIYFRGTNRYSIVILCLVLLYLARELTRWTGRWRQWQCVGFAGALIVIGFLDQTPVPPTRKKISTTHAAMLADKDVTKNLEAKLSPHAMVFELPVVDFPEMPPVVHMADYEHLRPFLHSKSLRFSYGSDKGRTREDWQKDALLWGPSHLVSILEKYGFSAVLINRKGYEDRGMSILDGLRGAGRTNILVDSGDFVAVKLEPAPHPVLPPDFVSGWYGLEGTAEENWRWSSGDAKIVLSNSDRMAKPVHVRFALATLMPRFVNVTVGAQSVYQASLAAGPPQRVELALTLAPGETELRFATDTPADFPSNGDPRKLAIMLRDFDIFE